MFKKEVTEAVNSMAAINDKARQARRLCNDIIRQTSLKPYYGKRGGAAMYAAESTAEAQRLRISTAVRNMSAAVRNLSFVTQMLRDIAIVGGMTATAIEADMQEDYLGTKVTIIDDDSKL